MSEARDDPIPWSEPTGPGPPSEPGPFQIRGFWIAWIVSGFVGAAFGALWTIHTNAVSDLDVTTRSLSSISLSGHLGIFVGVILGLKIADRFPKTRAIRLCYYSMAACSTIAGIVALFGIAPIPLLYVSYVVIGVLSGLSTPLIWGLVAELMPRTLLAKSIVMLSWSGAMTALLGALLGTLVFSDILWEARYEVAFPYAAVLLVGSGLLTRRLPRHAGNVRFPGGLRDAVSFLFRSRRLRALWVYGVVASGCLAVFSSSVGIFAYFDLGGVSEFAVLLIARGGAAIFATIGVAFVISDRRGWPVVLICSGIAAILCIAIGAADTFWPLLGLMIPFGAASAAATLGASALAMGHTRFGYFGRVAALLFIGGSASSTGIALLGIVLSDWGQGRGLVMAAGIVLLAASLLLYRTWRATRAESSLVDGVARTPSTGLIADIAAPQKPSASD